MTRDVYRLYKLDAWIRHLAEEHPAKYWALAVAIAAGLFALVSAVEWVLQ